MSLVVAITGATGFIGQHLTAGLLTRGIEVRAIVRPESRNALPVGASAVRVALSSAALGEALVGVDAVVHLAGILATVRAAEFTAINVEGTRAVAEAARSAGAYFVHVSSLAAAGPGTAQAPRREDDVCRPITPYGASKLASERAVAAVPELRWTILRPGAVYGPSDRAVLPVFRMACSGFLPLVGRSSAAYTFVHVRDVVAAIVATIDRRPAGDTMFVGHPRAVTAREILTTVRSAVHRSSPIVPIPRPLVAAAAVGGEWAGRALGRPLSLNRARYAEMYAEGFVCSVERLRDRLGVVAAIDLDEGFAETAEWYRREGWL